MITIAQEIERIIKSSSFLEEGIRTEIINLSSLARKIQPEIEKNLKKTVTHSAILMALKRFSDSYKHLAKKSTIVLNEINDIMIRSNLSEFTFHNSSAFIIKQENLLNRLVKMEDKFLTFTRGVYENTIIISSDCEGIINDIFKGEKRISQIKDLSAIIIKLTPQIVETPGVHYSILKQLAWHDINVTEVVSTYTELTIILKNSFIDKAFSALKSFLWK